MNENKGGDEALSKVRSAQMGLIGVSESLIPRDGKEHHCLLLKGA